MRYLVKAFFILTFLYTQATLCMLMPFASNKANTERCNRYYAKEVQPKILKRKELLDKLNNKPLLLENSPFNFSELPDDIQLKIFYSVSVHDKNRLHKTCNSLYTKGSKQPPYVWKLVNHLPLNIAEKDVSDIVLKAILYQKTDVLEKILQNHKKRNFIYEYTDSTEKVKPFKWSYDEYTVEKTLSFDAYQAAPTKNISDILKKYNCTMLKDNSQKTNIKLTPLITACFMQDEKMLTDIIRSYRNFSENEILTVLEHNQKINNPAINNLLVTKFPIAHYIYQQNQMIVQMGDVIKSLTKKCLELTDDKENLLKQLADAQDNLQRERRINSPNYLYSGLSLNTSSSYSPSYSYFGTPTYNYSYYPGY